MDEQEENENRDKREELRRATKELSYRSGYIRERTAEVTTKVRYALANVREMLRSSPGSSGYAPDALADEADYEEQLLEFERWRRERTGNP